MHNEPRHHYLTIPDAFGRERGMQEIKPRRLHYTEWGDPQNPKILICVHGLIRNGRDFDILARQLANTYRVICPDIVGRGQSDWLTDGADYTYQTYVQDLLQLIMQLNITELDWLGTSMGGLIGIFLTPLVPGIVQRLILNDVGPFIEGEQLSRIARYVGLVPIFKNLAEAMAYMKKAYAPFGITEHEHWQHFTESSVRQLDNGTWTTAYDPAIGSTTFRSEKDGKISDFDGWPFWEQVQCPTLIIRGGDSDILSPETYQRMLASRSNIEGIEFPGVGHAPALMDTAQIQAISDWLKRPPLTRITCAAS
jgi:pimeloyl-ACP methyl ester carboxylesterase